MSVFVGVPHTRAFEGEFIDSLLYMYKPEGMIWQREPNLPVDVARNRLASKFLHSKMAPEYLLLIDSDATWAPLALMRLMSRDLPVVSGCIYRRGLPPVPTFGPHVGIDQDGYHAYDFGWSTRKVLEHAGRMGIDATTANALVLPETTDDLLEVDGTGLHFCMIRRDVIEQTKPPWFSVPTNDTAGEDFYFCRRVQEAGFTIHVDLSVHTGHLIGPGFDYGLRELLAFDRYASLDTEAEKWAV